MNTGDNTGIVINNDTIYLHKYCTSFTSNGECQESITILGMGKEEVKQSGVEILTTCSVFILVVCILVWFVKGFFRLIFPSKGNIKKY